VICYSWKHVTRHVSTVWKPWTCCSSALQHVEFRRFVLHLKGISVESLGVCLIGDWLVLIGTHGPTWGLNFPNRYRSFSRSPGRKYGGWTCWRLACTYWVTDNTTVCRNDSHWPYLFNWCCRIRSPFHSRNVPRHGNKHGCHSRRHGEDWAC